MFRKKNLLSLFIVLALSSYTAAAKKADDVTAIVKDSQSKQPIEFASVELLNAKDSLLTGCITDSKGYFQITAPARATKLRIHFVGYKTLETPINRSEELGTLLLEEDSKLLNEVTVKGSARTNKVDRDIYNITKELRSGTVSSQELLGKLNGVNYNRYDKSISVNGSTKILILIDGIEKDQDMAKNLPSDRIERIEVIKDPVGKYATDGYTAVINMVLKKDYSGIDAFVTNTSVFDIVGTNGDDVLSQDAGNMNITYTYKKLNLYTSGRIYGSNFSVPTELVKRYGNITTVSEPLDLNNPNALSKSRNGKITFGADYALSKKHSLSAEIRYSGDKDKSSAEYNLINSLGSVVTSNSYSLTNSDSHTNNWQGVLTYKGKFDDKNSIDADLRYNYSSGYNQNYFQQDKFSSNSNIDQSGNYARLNVNYNHQFSPELNMDLGYGNVYNQNTNKLNSSSFTQNEYRNRVSLYLNYKPIQQISLKAGAIVENYTQKNSTSNVNRTAIMPYANIQYAPSQKFNVVAKYHVGAGYPDINQLSPFRTAQDSLMWSIGNPALRTNINHSLSLDINIQNFITLTPYYNFNHSSIASYVSIDPTNSALYLSQNVNADKYEQYGASLNFTIPFGKTIFWQNRLDWNKNRMAYLDDSYNTNNFTANSTLVYVMQKAGLVAGVVYQKMLRHEVSIQGYGSNGNNLLLAFLQKSFFKEKLNASLMYIFPVNFISYDQSSLTQAKSYYQYSNVNLNLIKNLVFLEISYRFNAGKQVKKKQSDDSDEITRSKKGGIGL